MYQSKHKSHVTVHKFDNTFSSTVKRSVRPLFIMLLLIVLASTLGCRVAVRNGFRSLYAYGGDENPILDLSLYNSTLLKLAETDLGEADFNRDIKQLLDGKLYDPGRFRTFAMWRKYFNKSDMYGNSFRRTHVDLRSEAFSGVWEDFRWSLSDWDSKRIFHSDIMDDLLSQVKVPIDRHNEFLVGLSKYSSCAVVGNSGILLSKEYGKLIDSHEAVIRLNNAKIEPHKKNVGSKTSISFVNSNILHSCTQEEDCSCHPYGVDVPIVMYICQPAQFLDYVLCSTSHNSPLIVTDSRFDMLCARIVKYYSLKRYGVGRDRTLEEWIFSHDGPWFHYSSGMQAVTLALGIYDRVSLFGFGKSATSKHHYHTNQTKEYRSHDFEAEYDFYHDLVRRPRAIPFFSETFEFPPVVIHR